MARSLVLPSTVANGHSVRTVAACCSWSAHSSEEALPSPWLTATSTTTTTSAATVSATAVATATASATVASHLIQTGINLLLGLSKDSNKVTGLLRVCGNQSKYLNAVKRAREGQPTISSEEGDGGTLGTGTASSADAVDVILRVVRVVIVEHVRDIPHILQGKVSRRKSRARWHLSSRKPLKTSMSNHVSGCLSSWECYYPWHAGYPLRTVFAGS